jgi:hypothetical protein
LHWGHVSGEKKVPMGEWGTFVCFQTFTSICLFVTHRI